ncbi:MAG: PD-(D/E)XK nuclease family protein, partial [Cyanobacteria bacterium P01_D01_bin.73]
MAKPKSDDPKSNSPKPDPPKSGDTGASLWPLSQSQLNVLTACPRQFQHQFLEQRSLPTNPEFQDAMEWGQRFHRLMERYILGLSIEPWLEGDRELAACFTALQNSLPKNLPSLTDSSATQLC